ncbi:hypothetical protein GOP47_0005862 [Adiantum capillus-veneris]|uniref:RING-type domain-containing protein n=1 Tax=Adiantum capillus-veneris TaxID=13818 RepID=A0A9D4V667_ADICA|nr:hypothetical protein GOP47_0005862 [Adiantum capillus-veneris]
MAACTYNESSSSCSRSSSYTFNYTEASEEEEDDRRFECPVCWEGFNSSSRLPYILWCGHSLCKSCLLRLEWATLELPVAAVQLPLLIACPWCQSLSGRLVWRPSTAKLIKYPRPNYSLLWLLQRAAVAGRPIRYHHRHHHAILKTPSEDASADYQQALSTHLANSWELPSSQPQSEVLSLQRWLRKFNGGLLLAKAFLLLLLIFIVFWALPFCALVLMVHLVATLLLAFPAFLVVYFASPSLSWLFREIVS